MCIRDRRIPLALLEDVLLLVGNLNQPSAAVGFVNARRVVALGSHLALPAVDLHGRLDERTEEDARIAVGELFEFERQVEVVVIFARGEIAVLLDVYKRQVLIDVDHVHDRSAGFVIDEEADRERHDDEIAEEQALSLIHIAVRPIIWNGDWAGAGWAWSSPY